MDWNNLIIDKVVSITMRSRCPNCGHVISIADIFIDNQLPCENIPEEWNYVCSQCGTQLFHEKEYITMMRKLHGKTPTQ